MKAFRSQLILLPLVRPNGGSLIAAGVWGPGKNELATIRSVAASEERDLICVPCLQDLPLILSRSHILRDPSRLREVIGAKEFVDVFGPAKPHKKGERQNVFGSEDMLKVAPKGVDKTHP